MNVASEICMYYLYLVVFVIIYGTFPYLNPWLQKLMRERDQSVGAWREFIFWIQVQVLFQRILRGLSYKVEGSFGGKK
jgi:hypothetical protein